MLKNKEWLIWSNVHHGWWTDDRVNCTRYIESAGLYTYDEAFQICANSNNNTNGPPDELMVHQQNIKNTQEKL